LIIFAHPLKACVRHPGISRFDRIIVARRFGAK
jgi:hypothetical protein